jgi:hypothetical protein
MFVYTVLFTRFSWSHRGSNKIVKENQDRGWFRDGPRCPKQVSVKSCLLLPRTKFSKVCVFWASVNFKAFFDRYLAVKSYLRVLKFFVEFINVSKTDFRSKIRSLWVEILAFFWDKVRRNSISLTFENLKTRIYWKFGLFWKACIVTFQKSSICPNKFLETSKLFEKIHFYSSDLPKLNFAEKFKEFGWIFSNNSAVSSNLLGHILLFWKVTMQAIQKSYPMQAIRCRLSKLSINSCFEILEC